MEIPQELWRKNYEESQILTSDNLAAAKRNGKWGFLLNTMLLSLLSMEQLL